MTSMRLNARASALERLLVCNDSIRRTQTGRAIVASLCGAKIGAAAAAVVSDPHVEQCRAARIDAAGVVHWTAIGAVDAGDQRRCYTGSSKDHPTGPGRADRPVNGDAGIGIGNGRGVCDRALGATRVELPTGLCVQFAAAASRAGP